MIEQRIEKLRAALRERQVEALLIASPVNRRYMTGFTGTEGYVVVTLDKACIYTDFRYREQVRKQAAAYECVEVAQGQYLPVVRELLREEGIKRVAFEQDLLSYADYARHAAELPGIELVPAEGLVEGIRLFKDEQELQIIREACELADRTFVHLQPLIKPGVSERDIALEIEFFMRRGGADSTSFDTIVASGERSAMPHGVASDRKIGSGEFVTMDFGAYYKGYCSDITRTVVVGKADARHREIYGIVLEAQMAVLDKVGPGMTGKEAHQIACDVIGRYGYLENFGHGTGHGLGMEIHEAPRLNARGDTVLQPGMVVTVEPGIYLSGFGGVRIEDDIVITKTGAELLTRSDKQLLTL